MRKSDRAISRHELERCYTLWDELSDYGAEDSEAALVHCLGRLCGWLDADNAFWIGAVRVMTGKPASHEALLGWRAAAARVLHEHHLDNRPLRETLKRLNEDDPGETSAALVRQAGHFRAYRLRAGELVDFSAFRKTGHYDGFYRQLGIADRLWVVIPLSEEAECYYCLDKYGKRREFSESDITLAANALRGIKWFHRQLMLSHGLGIANEALTPTERRVLQQLLTGATEKAIAASLGVTTGTAHQYVLGVYRKFGVRSKAKLLALWLRQKI